MFYLMDQTMNLNLGHRLSYSFIYFFGCTEQHVASEFPDQGSNPCYLQWKQSPNH